MNIINCTPHPIKICNPDTKEVLVTFKKGEVVPRLHQDEQYLGCIDYGRIGIAVTKTVFGEVQNLPEQQEDTIYIVSRLVKQACPDRTDLLVPGGVIRDDEGRIIGCSGLSE